MDTEKLRELPNALRELAAAATPGPWDTDTYNGMTRVVSEDGDAVVPWTVLDSTKTFDYIAAANPAAITALLDKYDTWRERAVEAERKVAALEEERDRLLSEAARAKAIVEARVAALEAAIELADRVAASFMRRESGHVTEGKVQEYQRWRGDMDDTEARALLAANDSEGGSGSLVPQVQALPPAAPSEPPTMPVLHGPQIEWLGGLIEQAIREHHRKLLDAGKPATTPDGWTIAYAVAVLARSDPAAPSEHPLTREVRDAVTAALPAASDEAAAEVQP